MTRDIIPNMRYHPTATRIFVVVIENSRIELKGIVLPVPEGKCGWIIGRGGGAKGMLASPLKLLGGRGGWPPCPPHPLLFLRLWSYK